MEFRVRTPFAYPWFICGSRRERLASACFRLFVCLKCVYWSRHI